MNKHEKKYANTEEKLFRALLSLLEKKEFLQISVQDVCKEAGVSRTTFYQHYANTADLSDSLMRSMIQAFSQDQKKQKPIVLQEELRKEGANSLVEEDTLIAYLRFLKEHQRLVKVYWSNPRLFHAKDHQEALVCYVFEPLYSRLGIQDKDKVGYYAAFYLAGVNAVVSKWVLSGCVEKEEEIADLLRQCILSKKESSAK